MRHTDTSGSSSQPLSSTTHHLPGNQPLVSNTNTNSNTTTTTSSSSPTTITTTGDSELDKPFSFTSTPSSPQISKASPKMESIKPFISQPFHVKGSSLETKNISSDPNSPRKTFGFHFNHSRSSSLTKISSSLIEEPINQPTFVASLKSAQQLQQPFPTVLPKNDKTIPFPSAEAIGPAPEPQYPQGFSANQTQPLNGRGPYSPVAEVYSQTAAGKRGTDSKNNSSSTAHSIPGAGRLLEMRRKKKKKHGGSSTSTGSSSNSSSSNGSISGTSIFSMVSGIGSINGFERDRIEKSERQHGLDLRSHSRQTSNITSPITTATNESKLPRKISSSSNTSTATSSVSTATDMDTNSSTTSSMSSRETPDTAVSGLVSPVGASNSTNNTPHQLQSSQGLTHSLPFTVASRPAVVASTSAARAVTTVPKPSDTKSYRQATPNSNSLNSSSNPNNFSVSNPPPLAATATGLENTSSKGLSFSTATLDGDNLSIENGNVVHSRQAAPSEESVGNDSGLQKSGYSTKAPSSHLPSNPQSQKSKVVPSNITGTPNASNKILFKSIEKSETPTRSFYRADNSTNASFSSVETSGISSSLLRTQKPASSFTRISPANSPLLPDEIEDSEEDEYDQYCSKSKNLFDSEAQVLINLQTKNSNANNSNNSNNSAKSENNSGIINSKQVYEEGLSSGSSTSINNYMSADKFDKFSCTRPLLMSMQVLRDSLVSVDDDTLSYMSGFSGTSNQGERFGNNGSASVNEIGQMKDGDLTQNTLTKSTVNGNPINNSHFQNQFQQHQHQHQQPQPQQHPNGFQLGKQFEPSQNYLENKAGSMDHVQPNNTQFQANNLRPALLFTNPNNQNTVQAPNHKFENAYTQFSNSPQTPTQGSSIPSTPIEHTFSGVQQIGSADSQPTVISTGTSSSVSSTPTGIAITTSHGPATTVIAGSPSKKSPGSPVFHKSSPSSYSPITIPSNSSLSSSNPSTSTPRSGLNPNLHASPGYQSRFLKKNVSPPALSIQTPTYRNKNIIVTHEKGQPDFSPSTATSTPFVYPAPIPKPAGLSNGPAHNSSPVLQIGSGQFATTANNLSSATSETTLRDTSAMEPFGEQHAIDQKHHHQQSYHNHQYQPPALTKPQAMASPISVSSEEVKTAVESSNNNPKMQYDIGNQQKSLSYQQNMISASSSSTYLSGPNGSARVVPKMVVSSEVQLLTARFQKDRPQNQYPNPNPNAISSQNQYQFRDLPPHEPQKHSASSLQLPGNSGLPDRQSTARASALYDYELDFVDEYINSGSGANSRSPSLSPALAPVSVSEH